MFTTKTKQIRALLAQKENGLTPLLEKITLLNELDNLLKRELDPMLKAHCCVANIRNNNLIISTESGVWATQLRFITPQLLTFFRQHAGIPSLRSISITVDPRTNKARQIEKPRPQLSLKNLDLLKATLTSLRAQVD